MIMIPRPLVPYVLIVLSFGSVILLFVKDSPEKISAGILCTVIGIGSIVWAYIDYKRSKED